MLSITAIKEYDAMQAPFLEPFIAKIDPDYQRPMVFDPAAMRAWLEIDIGAACCAMRTAGGWVRMPGSRDEALELLDPLGCKRLGDNHWIKAAHASVEYRGEGQWRTASCCDCGHPFIDYFDYRADRQTTWSLFEDLR